MNTRQISKLLILVSVLALTVYSDTSTTTSPTTSAKSTQTSTTATTQTTSTDDTSTFSSSLKALNQKTASQSVTANQNNRCVSVFINLLKDFPQETQDLIVTEFLKTTSGSCCDAATLQTTIKDSLYSILNNFSQTMTDQTVKAKMGLGCYRSQDMVTADQGMDLDASAISDNKTFIESMLLTTNFISADLANCMTYLHKLSLSNISLMCVDPSLYSTFFVMDVNGKALYPKRTPDTVHDLTFKCSFGYVQRMNDYTNIVLDAFVDNINFLIGTDKCNYYSNFFSFDSNVDTDDPMFPTEVPKTQQNYESSALIDKWATCSNISFGGDKTSTLKNKVIYSQQTNPNGLSTYIGRSDINFNVIKDTFNVKDYPSFYIHCENSICNATCTPSCSSFKDAGNVVQSNTTVLDVSCCDSVCLINVQISDTINSSPVILSGAEVFLITGDMYARDFDKLLLAKLSNFQSCTSNSQSSTLKGALGISSVIRINIC
jgi:hypothetical protein